MTRVTDPGTRRARGAAHGAGADIERREPCLLDDTNFPPPSTHGRRGRGASASTPDRGEPRRRLETLKIPTLAAEGRRRATGPAENARKTEEVREDGPDPPLAPASDGRTRGSSIERRRPSEA